MSPFWIGFIVGIPLGLLISILIVATLTFFKKSIQQHMEIVERRIEVMGPQPRGFIVEPDDEATEAREAIIKRNRAEGRDTRLEELM